MNTADRPVALRARGFEPRLRPALAWLALAATLVLWQIGSTAGVISALTLPSPLRIAAAIGDLASSGELWGHLAASAGRIAGGFLLGFSTGLVAGLAIGIFTLSRSIGLPVVSALFPIPKIALLPLFILWFGIGEWSKIATIAFGVFFPTVVATYSAVDSVPRNLVRMGQSFGLEPAAITTKILLPGRAPRRPLRRADRDLDRADPGGRRRDDRRRARHRRAHPHLGPPDDDRPTAGRSGDPLRARAAGGMGARRARTAAAAMALKSTLW